MNKEKENCNQSIGSFSTKMSQYGVDTTHNYNSYVPPYQYPPSQNDQSQYLFQPSSQNINTNSNINPNFQYQGYPSMTSINYPPSRFSSGGFESFQPQEDDEEDDDEYQQQSQEQYSRTGPYENIQNSRLPRPQPAGVTNNRKKILKNNERTKSKEKIRQSSRSKSGKKVKIRDNSDEDEEPKELNPIQRLKQIRINRVKNEILIKEVNNLKKQYDTMRLRGEDTLDNEYFIKIRNELFRLQGQIVPNYSNRPKNEEEIIALEKHKRKNRSKK